MSIIVSLKICDLSIVFKFDWNTKIKCVCLMWSYLIFIIVTNMWFFVYREYRFCRYMRRIEIWNNVDWFFVLKSNYEFFWRYRKRWNWFFFKKSRLICNEIEIVVKNCENSFDWYVTWTLKIFRKTKLSRNC